MRKGIKRTLYVVAVASLSLLLFASCSASTSTNTGSDGGEVVKISGDSYSHGAYDTADSLGKPVVVNFWFPSCPPCVFELPFFQSVYEDYKDRVEFVGLQGIHVDGPEEGPPFLADLGITYPNLPDTEFLGITEFRIAAYPATIFLDKDHKATLQHVGTLDAAQLIEIIETLL